MVKVEFTMNDGSPVRAVKVAEPKKLTLYIDTYEEKAYKTIEEIANAMAENQDIDDYDEWLCQNYTASAIVNMANDYGCGEALTILKEEYEGYKVGAALDLLACRSATHYFTVEVEI